MSLRGTLELSEVKPVHFFPLSMAAFATTQLSTPPLSAITYSSLENQFTNRFAISCVEDESGWLAGDSVAGSKDDDTGRSLAKKV